MNKKIKRRALTTNILSLPDGLHPLIRQIYQSRGITAESDYQRELAGLIPFTELKGINTAVTCLGQAIQNNKRILIIGDFDADGATSTALAMRALYALGAANVDFLVPNRFTYGYGLTPEIVAVAAERKPNLLITVDNGITSLAGVAAAKDLGMQVIITDHHLAGPELPIADAIINPNQPGCNFPSKNLAGVGVVFYLMMALRHYLREQDWFVKQNIAEPNLAQFLDIVALGTVADVVPLDKNNRILVHQGLARIRTKKCCAGISALLSIAKREIHKITATDLGFAVGPRLNAAGRLDDMTLGIACLLTDDVKQATEMATMLDELNHERRTIEQTMQLQAHKVLTHLFNTVREWPLGICLYDPEWHQGVSGILAGRLKEHFHRPTIVFATGNAGELKGSARSIPGLHIRDLLESIALHHPGLVVKFGGHAMAAGLSIAAEDFSKFQSAFQEALALHLDPILLQQEVLTDGELQAQDISIATAEAIINAGPWGQHFPEPIFDNEFTVLQQRLVGERHLKMVLSLPNSNQVIDAIMFNIDLKQWPNQRISQIHAAYRLDINEYRDRRQVQLVIEHLEPVT